jgi:hypothetical protein
MTTFHLKREDQGQDLADALADAARYASPDAVAALTELRITATPDNRNVVAHVRWDEHGPLAATLRRCADSGHPLGDRLRGLADALDNQLRTQAMNNAAIRHLVPPPPPAPESEPVPEHVGGY